MSSISKGTLVRFVPGELPEGPWQGCEDTVFRIVDVKTTSELQDHLRKTWTEDGYGELAAALLGIAHGQFERHVRLEYHAGIKPAFTAKEVCAVGSWLPPDVLEDVLEDEAA